MTELIQEIYGTIMRNKLRTLLTGFSVAWGIFMLIVLLGAGNGLIHAFENQSEGMLMNSMKIYPGMTSEPYKGMKEGRSIYLKESDRALTGSSFPDHILETGATVSKSDVTLTYGKEALSIELDGVLPNYPSLEAIKIKEGRFINKRDIEEKRKVIVLHEKTVKNLFPHTAPIGKYLNAQGVSYQVVGIYKDQNSFSPSALVPFTTLQTIYQKGDSIDNITFTTQGLANEALNEQFEADYRRTLGLKKQFSPTDDGAIWIWNRFTQYLQQQSATKILHTAIWVIGIFTLLSGMQHHAHYRPRTDPRVRHPQSTGGQTDVHPLADYFGKCSHHHLLRLHRHGGGHCRHGIHEPSGRKTDHGHGCLFHDLLREPHGRPLHCH